jgi:hypothetical protein
MARGLATVLTLVLMGCASIAGLDSTEGARPATEPAEAGAEREQAAATFTCGAQACTAGKQACCVHATTFECVDVAVGCTAPAQDGGGDAAPSGPPVTCTTYNNCGEDDCCYDPISGSACRSSCSSGQARLCRLGVDGCGDERQCVPMTSSPLPETGECVSSGGS